MNKEQYDALNEEQKAIATEAYLDGFEACMDQVASIVVRVGNSAIDNNFISNRNTIHGILETNLGKIKEVK